MKNPTAPKETLENLENLKTRIDELEVEKAKLKAELKSREEMMNSLLSYIQSTKP